MHQPQLNTDLLVTDILDAWLAAKSLKDASLPSVIKVIARYGAGLPFPPPFAQLSAFARTLEEAGYSNNYRLKVFRVLKAACYWYRERYGIDVDIRWPRLGGQKAKLRFLSLEEQQAALVAAEKEHPSVANALVLFLDTGVRLGEALGLTTNCVKGNNLHVWRTKTKTATEIPLTRRVRKHVDSVRGAGGLWLVHQGEVAALRRLLANHLDQTKGKVTIHTLRHTFATNLLRNGVSMNTIAYLLGHASIKQTMIYAHVQHNPEEAEAAINAL